MKKNSKLLSILIGFILVISLAKNASFAETPEVYEINISQTRNVSNADKLFKEGNIDGALSIYNKMLEQNPDSIEARNGRANIYSDLYKLKAAQREFQKVLQQDPNNSDAHNGLGLSYYRMTTSSNMDIRQKTSTLYRKAIGEFKKAIDINPNNDEALANLGAIYQQQGRAEEAEVQYKKSLAINPFNSNANYRLGTIMYEKGDLDSAIANYNKSIQVDSKNSSAHYHLGEALIAKGNYSSAIDSLQTSLYLKPNSAPVHEKLGEAYKHQGNETAAIESFKKAISIKPEDTLSYLLLSSIYEDRGDYELAVAELRSALKNNPDFTEAKLKIADMSLQLGKTDQAIEYYQITLIEDPGNPQAEKGLSKAYFRKVQTDVSSGIVASPQRLVEAEKIINKAILNNPDDLELHYARFKVEKLANKPEPNIIQLEAMAAKLPTNIPEALDKGYAQFMLKDFTQANNTFKGIMNQVTDQDDRLMIAETLIEYGDYNLSNNIFNTVLQKSPENVQAKRGLENIRKRRTSAQENYRLGWDLYKKGQRNSSLDQFTKAKKHDPTFEKPYYWAAEVLKKDDKLRSAYENYSVFLALTEDPILIQNDKDLEKRRKHAEKMVKKLQGKSDK